LDRCTSSSRPDLHVEQARAALQKALELNPSFQPAQDLWNRIAKIKSGLQVLHPKRVRVA
jgi:hypothetical protein